MSALSQNDSDHARDARALYTTVTHSIQLNALILQTRTFAQEKYFDLSNIFY